MAEILGVWGNTNKAQAFSEDIFNLFRFDDYNGIITLIGVEFSE